MNVKAPWPHPIIAKEGWVFIGVGALLTLFFIFGWRFYFLAGVCGFFTVFALQFFRDPQRVLPQTPDAVLSPADGRIVKVVHAYDPYAKRDAILVSVFMNVFNVHSNRAAVSGDVRDVRYFPGKFFNADLDKASLENERNAVIIDVAADIAHTDKTDGAKGAAGTRRAVVVTQVQVAGLIARRILCYTKIGARLAAGERYGFIRFGSRVDVFLPLHANIRVAPGDKVKATATVLATL